MGNKNNSISISLTGGLGNQLFQLAAASAVSHTLEVDLLSTLAKPRTSKDGKVELLSFKLPSSVKEVHSQQLSPLAQKSAGYVLRMGVSSRWYEKPKFIFETIRYLASFVISLELRKIYLVEVGRGVGFFDTFTSRSNSLLIGYFQSYKWASTQKTRLMLMELKPKEIGVELKQLMALAIDENPLVVHLRLGDYLLESSFGVPPKSYYQESISELMATGIYGKVWLFSDDLKKAQEYLSPELLITARVIGNVDDSTVATLEAMRHGKGYVIANSTFSWWGAFLSYENNPVVVAPTPWFQGMDSPQELIPPHWILKAAN